MITWIHRKQRIDFLALGLGAGLEVIVEKTRLPILMRFREQTDRQASIGPAGKPADSSLSWLLER